MKTKTFLLVIMLLLVFVSNNAWADTPYSIEDAWLEGKLNNVADPSGVIQYSNVYGGHGTQTLTDPVFTKVDTVNNTSTSSYIAPSNGLTGLYSQSESNIGSHTYVETVSYYCDTFTFDSYNFFNPVHINLSMGMSYRFISPVYDWNNAKAGGVEMAVYFYDPITDKTKKIGNSASENHTTGGWDTPPGSMGIYNDLGQYLHWYSGRATDTFLYGDQVTLLFEYRTWAQDGAIVDAISTGDFKFLLSAADRDNGYLEVTSSNGYYQVDGVPPTTTPEPTSMLFLVLGMMGLAGVRRKLRKQNHETPKFQEARVRNDPSLRLENLTSTVQVGQSAQVSVSFYDSEGNISTVFIREQDVTSNYSAGDLLISGNSGKGYFSVYYPTTASRGQHNYEVWVTDAKGNRSNTLSFSINVN